MNNYIPAVVLMLAAVLFPLDAKIQQTAAAVDLCPAEAGPLCVENFLPSGPAACDACRDGSCRKPLPYHVDDPRLAEPDLAASPPREAPQLRGRERSIVCKRSCAPRVHKRGFFARLRARRR